MISESTKNAIMIRSFTLGPLGVNTFVIYREGDSHCIIIDPAEPQGLDTFLEEEGLNPSHILLTHGHFDHILGVSSLADRYHPKVLIHRDDAPMLNDDLLNLSAFFGSRPERITEYEVFDDGAKLNLSGMAFRVLHTPGHSPGSCCYALDEAGILFTGDTLFFRSAGRTDFPGGNEQYLNHSLNDRLFSLEMEYTVYPGHGAFTTLQTEKKMNPFSRY